MLLRHDLILSENQIEYPTAAYMDTWLAAVVQHVGVRAPRVFKRVGQDRQALEGSLGRDRLRQTHDRAGQPGGGEALGAEGVAEDVAEQHHEGSAGGRDSESYGF